MSWSPALRSAVLSAPGQPDISPDLGDGTSPPPDEPFVIDGSTLGLGPHTITVTYEIWNEVAWPSYTVDVPVTVTAT